LRKVSLNDLEVEIIREIKKWIDELISEGMIQKDDIDAGDAASLASEIAIHIIGDGVGIVGEWKAERKLSEGWEDEGGTLRIY